MLSKILCNLKKNISAFLPHKLCAVLPLRFNWASNKNYSVSHIFHFLHYTIERYYSQDNVRFNNWYARMWLCFTLLQKIHFYRQKIRLSELSFLIYETFVLYLMAAAWSIQKRKGTAICICEYWKRTLNEKRQWI